MSIRLRTCLAVIFVAVIVLVSAVVSAAVSRSSGERFRAEIGGSLGGVAYQVSDKLDNFMWSRSGELDILAGLDAFQEPVRKETVRTLLDQLKTSFPSFTWVGFLDAKGTVVASTDGILNGADISARPVYREALKGKFIGDVHDAKLLAKLLPNPTGEPLQFVDISLPLKGGDGRLTGILAAHLSWTWAKEVSRSVIDPVKKDNGGLEVLIVSARDRVVLLGPAELQGKPLPVEVQGPQDEGGAGWSVQEWPDGREYLTAYARGDGYLTYKGLGWQVLVREPADAAFAPVRQLRREILGLGALAAVLFGLLAWFIAGRITQPIRAIAAAADRLGSGELTEIPAGGIFREIRHLSVSMRRMVDNLTQTEKVLHRMEDLALRDALTGLPNRLALDRFLDEPRPAHAFLYMDLDGFKKINDSLGHAAGDQLLKQVADRLSQLVPREGLVARLGGDEFVIVLPSGAELLPDEVRGLGQAVIASVNEPILIGGTITAVGCSVGAALQPLHAAEPAEAMRLADEALYRSKRSGKNRVTLHGDPQAGKTEQQTG